MKALCIKQPWIDMIAKGEKTLEVRSWRTNFRGEVTLCASKQNDKRFSDNLQPRGCTYAKAEIVGCRKMTKNDVKNTGGAEYNSDMLVW